MNKKFLTLAVAAAMVAPSAAMAEAILYGKLGMSIDWADVEGYMADPNAPGTNVPVIKNGRPDVMWVPGATINYKGWGLSQGGAIPGAGPSNRMGVKGSEDLGNGLKAIYQVEMGIQMMERSTKGNVTTGADNTISMRNTFIGLAGGWGTALVGRHDTPLKISTGKLDLFADTMADYNGTVGFDDKRVDNAIAYISPSLSGFQLAAAMHAGGASTAGKGPNVNADSLAAGYSLAGIYSNGPFYGSLAYESFGNELFMNSDLSLAGNCADDALSCDYVDDDYTKWRVGLGLLDWNGFTLTGIYEEQSNIPGGKSYDTYEYYNNDGSLSAPTRVYAGYEKLKLWQIQAGYAFGNNMVKAMYGSGNRDGRIQEANSIKEFKDTIEGDYFTWAIAFDHNFSKRTKAYVVYTQVDDDAVGSGWDGFSVGMKHSF